MLYSYVNCRLGFFFWGGGPGAVSLDQLVIKNHTSHQENAPGDWKWMSYNFFNAKSTVRRVAEETFWRSAQSNLGMGSDKALGPGSFTMSFYQACWEVMKGDLMQLFQNFHNNATFEKSLKATFLALIPKMIRSTNVKDYRPISLVNEVYKILSKVLANRLGSSQ